MATTSYTDARARFAELMDQVSEDREPVIITRRGHDSVALIAADDLDALIETVHLLRSRTNAERLLVSLARAKNREGMPASLATLRDQLELGDE